MKSAIVVAEGKDIKTIASKNICSYEINGQTLIEHLFSTLKRVGFDKVFVLSNDDSMTFQSDEIEKLPYHDSAMTTISSKLDEGELILVLKGNMPLLSEETINRLVDCCTKQTASKLVHQDGTNTGIFCFKNKGNQEGVPIQVDEEEILCVSNCSDLAKVSKKLKLAKNEQLMMQGVHIIDPNNTYIADEVIIGEGSIIHPNVTMTGKTVIGKHCQILTGSNLINAVLGDSVIIDSSKIEDSEVGSKTRVGPYSHLRNYTKIDENVRIGNFVEFKNSNFGKGSKCAHLTYIGDSDVGKDVNIGCGVVTVNYDGAHKFRTVIKDGAFIGSNVNLIAPVTVGKKALLAAGSTITEDVEDGAMGIARSHQCNKADFGLKYLDKGK